MRIYSDSSLFYARNFFAHASNKNMRTFGTNTGNNAIIDSLYGGNKETSQEDALLYKYWQENPLFIFDKDSGSKIIHGVSKIPKEFMDNLNNTEITEWDKNRLNYALDFSATGNDIASNLDCLVATYVTTLEHLKTNFSGDWETMKRNWRQLFLKFQRRLLVIFRKR